MPGPAQAAVPGLLEREAETLAVRQLIAQTMTGAGGAMVVEGAAGIGKSGLLDLAAEHARDAGARVLRVRGDVAERGFAWCGVIGLMAAAVLGVVIPGGATMAAALLEGELGGQVAAVAGTADEVAFTLLHGLTLLLGALSLQQPVLLVLDDAHWLDDETLRFVRFLLGRLDGLGVGLLLGVRTGDGAAPPMLAAIAAHPGVHRLAPAALSPDGVAQLVRERRGAETDDAFCARCAEVTGGNPFYLGELLQSLASEPDATLARLDGVTPPAVLRSVTDRVAAAGTGATAVVRALRVLGDDAPVHRVAALAGCDVQDATDAADRLAQADLVVSGPRLRFTHPLVGAAVEADIPAGALALAHADAARTLTVEGAAPEQVAAQLLSAPAASVAGAADVLREAAVRAMAGGAPGSAVAYLERALDEPAPAAAQAALRIALGQAAIAAGSPRAASHLEQALPDLAPGRPRAELLLALGWALHAAGRPGEAAQAFERGVAEVGDGDAAAELSVELQAGELTASMLDAQRAAGAHARIAAFTRGPAAESPGARLLSSQLLVMDLFAGTRSRLEIGTRASELLHHTLADPELVESWATWNAIGALSWCDRYDDAFAGLEIVFERASRSGSMLLLAMASYARAWPALWTGSVLQSAHDARQATSIWSAGAQMYLPAAVYWLASAVTELDRVAEAEAAVALVDDTQWRDTAFFCFALAARARVATAHGRLDDALALWLECGEHFVERMHAVNPALLSWRAEAAVLAARTGERGLAVRLARENLALAKRFGAPRALGEALRAAGLSGVDDDGVALLQRSVDVLRPTTARLELAHSLVDLGAALRRAGRPQQAREQLREGLLLADACGALALGRSAADELRAAGGRPRRRSELGHGPESLTSSEWRVAQLAADGLTNREIAARLFVTVKAVEWHLSRTYEKLEIGGRRELAAAGLSTAAG